MLKIDNITIAYKDVPTVMDFSLHMAQGQIVSSPYSKSISTQLSGTVVISFVFSSLNV